MLQREIGDLEFAIALIKADGDIDSDIVDYYRDQKNDHIWKWLHHNVEITK